MKCFSWLNRGLKSIFIYKCGITYVKHVAENGIVYCLCGLHCLKWTIPVGILDKIFVDCCILWFFPDCTQRQLERCDDDKSNTRYEINFLTNFWNSLLHWTIYFCCFQSRCFIKWRNISRVISLTIKKKNLIGGRIPWERR